MHELIAGMNAPLFFLTSARVFNAGHLKSVVRGLMGIKMSLGTGKLLSCSPELCFHTPSFPYPYALRMGVTSLSDPCTPAAAGCNGTILLGMGSSAPWGALGKQEQGRGRVRCFSAETACTRNTLWLYFHATILA